MYNSYYNYYIWYTNHANIERQIYILFEYLLKKKNLFLVIVYALNGRRLKYHLIVVAISWSSNT